MLAWYIFVYFENPNNLTASKILRVPRASLFAVYSGVSKLTATWLWAPRLYISLGFTCWIILIKLVLSVRSP